MGRNVAVTFPDHPQVPPMRCDIVWVASSSILDHLRRHGVDVCAARTMPGKAEYTTGDGVEHHATVRRDDHEDA